MPVGPFSTPWRTRVIDYPSAGVATPHWARITVYDDAGRAMAVYPGGTEVRRVRLPGDARASGAGIPGFRWCGSRRPPQPVQVVPVSPRGATPSFAHVGRGRTGTVRGTDPGLDAARRLQTRQLELAKRRRDDLRRRGAATPVAPLSGGAHTEAIRRQLELHRTRQKMAADRQRRDRARRRGRRTTYRGAPDDRGIEPSWISPLDLIGGPAGRGTMVGARVGRQVMRRVLRLVDRLLGRLVRRSPQALAARTLAAAARREGRRVVVNLGGAGEVPGAINVNNLSAQMTEGVPNLVRAASEEIDKLFVRRSVDEIVANRISHGLFDWAAVARGAVKVLRPGGRVSIAISHGVTPEHFREICRALRGEGLIVTETFKDQLVRAVKP